MIHRRRPRDRDHPGKTAGQGSRRSPLLANQRTGEPAGEADGAHHRDRPERRRDEVDVEPAGEGGRLDDETRGVESVETREDQHQPHQRECVLWGLNPGPCPRVVLSYTRSEMDQHAERKTPATPCTTADAIESWKPKLVVEPPPALQPQRGVHDPRRRSRARPRG